MTRFPRPGTLVWRLASVALALSFGSQSAFADGTAPDGSGDARHRIAENGRLTLELATLGQGGSLSLALSMDDVARGSDDHREARIACLDGRVRDAKAIPLPGEGTGLALEIRRDFLQAGKCMIQVDTAEKHSLSFRRYVLELR